MRTSLVVPALVAIVALALAAVDGCSLALEGLPGTGAGGSGGRASTASVGGAPITGSGTTTTSAMTSSSTGIVMCKTTNDCPSQDECATYECQEGQCVATAKNEGKKIDDLGGNCVKTVCHEGTLETQADDTDFDEDGNPCTIDGCKDKLATHVNAGDGTDCADDKRCYSGKCLQCGTAADCSVKDCSASVQCNAGTCEQQPKTNGSSCGLFGNDACVNGSCCAGIQACGSTCCNGIDICNTGVCCPPTFAICKGLCCGALEHCGANGCQLLP